jgi:hypothetical protein
LRVWKRLHLSGFLHAESEKLIFGGGEVPGVEASFNEEVTNLSCERNFIFLSVMEWIRGFHSRHKEKPSSLSTLLWWNLICVSFLMIASYWTGSRVVLFFLDVIRQLYVQGDSESVPRL